MYGFQVGMHKVGLGPWCVVRYRFGVDTWRSGYLKLALWL